jgi:cytochrome c biogenesis factor
MVAAGFGYCLGMHHSVALAVTGFAVLAVSSFVGSLMLEVPRNRPMEFAKEALWTLVRSRRRFVGYAVHLSFVALAIGVTGSSLGSRRHETVMREEETIHWADREIRFLRREQKELPDKFIVEAVLEVSQNGSPSVMLRPARHLHRLQKEWATQVDIESTWAGDFYTVLHACPDDGSAVLTFVENPMMRWIWCGGIGACLGGLAAICPRGNLRLKTGNSLADQSGVGDQSGAAGIPGRHAA